MWSRQHLFVLEGKWSLLSNKLCRSLDCEQKHQRELKIQKSWSFPHITGTSLHICRSPKRLSTFIFKKLTAGCVSKALKMQSKQAAVLQGRTWQCFNYFAASTGKVTARGKSTTRGSCQLPCLYKWFHERSAECVCLCRVFTDPNERMAKKKKKKGSYSLSHNLQWRWSKVKVAWLHSYCTYTLDYKLSPPVTSIAPLRNQHDVKKKKKKHDKKKERKDGREKKRKLILFAGQVTWIPFFKRYFCPSEK